MNSHIQGGNNKTIHLKCQLEHLHVKFNEAKYNSSNSLFTPLIGIIFERMEFCLSQGGQYGPKTML